MNANAVRLHFLPKRSIFSLIFELRTHANPVVRFTIYLYIACTILVAGSLKSQTPVIYRSQAVESSLNPLTSFFPFKNIPRPRIGLVLSGGGARGAAQIGVLQALEENDIPIDVISATSMGAIVGGLYASGYTTAEIESLAINTNWDELLSLTDEAKRTELSIDQKLADDWSFLVVRFEGLQPVLPHAISTGQRLTNFLNEQTLQALYHPNPSFNSLKIPFRAVSTDLVSGGRVVMEGGSLAEALRASSTVPLLFSPVERDAMLLVDGGLVTNIPVDVARSAGADIVIAVNSTSGLRKSDELKAPWQTADQIMGIMMQASNVQQLANADIVIKPAVGRHLSSNFKGLDSLITAGYNSTLEQIDSIRALYHRAVESMASSDSIEEREFEDVQIRIEGSGVPDSLLFRIRRDGYAGKLTSKQIREHIRLLVATGLLNDVHVEVFPDSQPVQVVYRLTPNPTLRQIEFVGNDRVSSQALMEEFRILLGRPLQEQRVIRAIEGVLRLYRKQGLSLARISHISFNEETGTLLMTINEGRIESIRIRGGVRTEDSFVLREFAMRDGEVFTIKKAKQGLTNLNSTKVFEYVYLEVTYSDDKPTITIRIAELPSQLIRLGIRADDERKLQGAIDIRDENFRGIGTELGLTLSGGSRNGLANLEFKTNRLFSSLFTFSIGGFATIFHSNVFADDPSETGSSHFNRIQIGEYADVRIGGRFIMGAQLERIGNATVEWSLQRARIRNIEKMTSLEERYTLSLLTFSTVIDSRNKFPFPSSGVNIKVSYEFSSKQFLSDVGYNAVRMFYESYVPIGRQSVLHPRILFGFADVTMPLGQQFRLGGREWMYGTREDDRRGRQVLALSLEYRYLSPISLVFDTYFRVRYDLATISEIPDQIKFRNFRHGIGAEIALDTPLGQASFGAGKSFYFARELPNNPFRVGPLRLYFVLGYDL